MFKRLKEFFFSGVRPKFSKPPQVTPALPRTNETTSTYNYSENYRKRGTESRRETDDDSGFTTSMAVAVATDNALLGALVGGDPVGTFVGQELSDLSSSSFNDFSGGGGASGEW